MLEMKQIALYVGTLAACLPWAGRAISYDAASEPGSLIVTVDETSAQFDAAQIVSGVQNIVKRGSGMLMLPSTPGYTGAWTVQEGVVQYLSETSFGPTAGADAPSRAVSVAAGAAVTPGSNVNGLGGRLVCIAGAGMGAGEMKGAFSKASNFSYYDMTGAHFLLTGDATAWTASGGTRFTKGLYDLDGHVLNLGGGAYVWAYLQSGVVFTNRDETAAATLKLPSSTNYKVSLTSAEFWGGNRNMVDATGSGRVYFNGAIKGDWTLRLKGSIRGSRTSAPQNDLGKAGWFGPGPVVVNGTATIGNDDDSNPGYGLSLNAPIQGGASSKVTVQKGAWVSFGGSIDDYAGSFELKGGSTNNAMYRCTAFFQKDVPFLTTAEKTVPIADSDLWMDGETVRQLPTLAISSGLSRITGSAAGSTIAAVSVAGGATNVLDTPAAIGAYTLTKGRLQLGAAAPSLGNLVCVDGEIDLNGHDMTVTKLTGQPRLTGTGTLTLTTWDLTLSPGEVMDCPAGIVLGEDVALSFARTLGALPVGKTDLLRLPAGASLSAAARLSATVEEGFAVSFTTREEGGRTVLSALVVPTTLPEAETVTAADRSTFEAHDQLLVITVPAAITNATDYADLVRAHFVTNIIKRGAGGLQATAMADYDGDFAVEGGLLLVANPADLGRERVGVTRVLDGGGLALANTAATDAIRNATVELAGAGPDGLGAIRGKNVNADKCSNNVFRLTADATWLNHGARFDIIRSVVDVAGHVLSIRPLPGSSWSQMGYFASATVTNSVPEQGGGVRIRKMSDTTTPKAQLDGPSAWWGGPQNEILWENRLYLGATDGDWTLVLAGGNLWGAKPAASVAESNVNYYAGSVRVTSNTTLSLNDTAYRNSPSKAYPVSFTGPISGGAGKTLTVDTAFHLFSSENTFAGKVVVTATSINSNLSKIDPPLRNGLWLHDGAVFSCAADQPVEFEDADLWFSDGTPPAMPAVKHVSGQCRIAGGGVSRPVIASLEKASADLLCVESTVAVTGLCNIAQGTLALGAEGAVPVFSNLVFAAGTTFDMNGTALTVPNLTGFPTLANAGALTVGESWTVSAAGTLASESSIGFAPDAVIRVPAAYAPEAGVPQEICRAQGGFTGALPAVADPRNRPWRVEVEGRSLFLTRVQDGTLFIFR